MEEKVGVKREEIGWYERKIWVKRDFFERNKIRKPLLDRLAIEI